MAVFSCVCYVYCIKCGTFPQLQCQMKSLHIRNLFNGFYKLITSRYILLIILTFLIGITALNHRSQSGMRSQRKEGYHPLRADQPTEAVPENPHPIHPGIGEEVQRPSRVHLRLQNDSAEASEKQQEQPEAKETDLQNSDRCSRQHSVRSRLPS